MNKESFEILRQSLQIILLVLSVIILPAVKKWIEQNTTKEQRNNAIFWTKLITKIAEEAYKNSIKSGDLKKDFVLKWLKNNKIELSDEQLGILIDMVVSEYNKNGWNL